MRPSRAAAMLRGVESTAGRSAHEIMLSVELNEARPRGVVRVGRSRQVEFEGWLQLMTAIEGVLRERRSHHVDWEAQ